MIKKNSVIFLSSLLFSSIAMADLDDDQLTGDLLLESTDASLKNRQQGVGTIRVKKQGHDKQQLTADELEHRFKRNETVKALPKKKIEKRVVEATKKTKEKTGDKFFWFFERDNHKDSDKQRVPDPLLDEL